MQSAGDYKRFKQLMRSKNEELDRQAMELLVGRGKAHPPPRSSRSNSIDESSDDYDLKEAIRYLFSSCQSWLILAVGQTYLYLFASELYRL